MPLALLPCYSRRGLVLQSRFCGLKAQGIATHDSSHTKKGMSWKSRFSYQDRPEGIFQFFFRHSPPATYASTAKKGKFIRTGHFIPHCMAFLEKGGELVLVYVFSLLHMLRRACPIPDGVNSSEEVFESHLF